MDSAIWRTLSYIYIITGIWTLIDINAWNANEDRLKELLAHDETVFVSGFLGNQEKLLHYFDMLIALTIDPQEHERRLRSRPKRKVGDDEQNIQRRIQNCQKAP